MSSTLALGSTRSLMIFCAVCGSGGISMVCSRRCWMRRAVKACTAWLISARSSSGRSRFRLMFSSGSPKRAALALPSRPRKSLLAISRRMPGWPDSISRRGSCNRRSSYRQGELVRGGNAGRRCNSCLPSIRSRRSGLIASSLRPVSSVSRARSSNWLCGNSTSRVPTASSSSTAWTRRAAGSSALSLTSRQAMPSLASSWRMTWGACGASAEARAASVMTRPCELDFPSV
ncbi:hypothetical protein BN889_05931 [Pseudomonas aeruginosa PA38182]|nr:hypothetical protein BN889_05931 [Pseudomonas aeruginosa PA38182]